MRSDMNLQSMTMYVPDSCEIILVQSTLPKHFKCSLPTDKSGGLRIPSSKYLIIILFLRLGQSPWDLGGRVPSLSLIVLLERLLQGQTTLLLRLRLKLRETAGIVRR